MVTEKAFPLLFYKKKLIFSFLIRGALFFLFMLPAAFADTLLDVVKHTLQTNPTALSSKAAYEASLQTLKKAQADYFPTLDLTVNAGREYSDTPTLRGSGIDGTTLTPREKKLTLSERLYTGGAVSNQVSQRRAQVEAAREDLDSTLENVALQAIKVYIDVLRNQALVAVSQDNVSIQESIARKINLRVSHGLSPRVDAELSQSRLSQSRVDLINAQNQKEIADANFLQVTGLQAKMLDLPHPPTKKIPGSMISALLLAEKKSPTIYAAKQKVDAAYSAVQVSKAPFYPKLDLQLSINRANDLSGSAGYNIDKKAMLDLTYNLFKGGADIAQYKYDVQQLYQAKDALNDERRKLDREVDVAWVNYVSDESRVTETKLYAKLSKETLTGYGKEFDIGRRSLFDLLNAEGDYHNAQTRQTNAKFDYVQDVYTILAKIGILVNTLTVETLHG